MRNLHKGRVINRQQGMAGIMGAAFVLAATCSQAAEKELLDILLANGAITAQQYEELLAKEELASEDVAELSFGNGSGLNVSSGDGRYEVEIGGRLHLDYVEHSADSRMGVEPISGTQVRRGRVEFDGVFDEKWNWAAEFDFAKNDVAIKDLKLGYELDNGATIFVGHQKQPYSLSLEMSSNDEPFVERGIDNFLVAPFTDRAIGIRTDFSGDNWFVAAGLFGDTLKTGGPGDEGWGSSARVVYAPVLSEANVVHLGLRGSYREIDASSPALSIKDKTSDFSELSIVNTGTLAGAETATLYGPEFGVSAGRFYAFGEYNVAEIERRGAAGLDFSSWHVGAAWTLTGESRAARYRIDAGEFKNLRSEQNFAPGSGNFGVIELAARLASIDLNDGSVVGGKEDAASLSLNWYPNNNVRFLLDWTRILDTDGSNTIRQFAPDMDIVTLRTQYNY